MIARYADNSRVIFDLGMNNGDDTAHYLARGYNVVAIEANPVLCEKASRRFAAAVGTGRLTVLNLAVSDRSGEAGFYLNLDNDHWSSLDLGWAGRDQSRHRKIMVRCVTMDNLFDGFGVPFYLKVDVEGADLSVLEQLRGHAELPRYVSVEDCRFGFQFIDILASCGYDGFKLLDQSTVGQMTDKSSGKLFPVGSSGPFGEDVPGEWLPCADMVTLYSSTVRDRAGTRLAPRTQWWDIHCTHRGRSDKPDRSLKRL